MSIIYYGRFTLLSNTNTAALNPNVMAKVLPSIGAERSGVACSVAVGMGIRFLEIPIEIPLPRQPWWFDPP